MSKLFDTLQALEGRQGGLNPQTDTRPAGGPGAGHRPGLQAERKGRGKGSVPGLLVVALLIFTVVVGLYLSDYLLVGLGGPSSSTRSASSPKASPAPPSDEVKSHPDSSTRAKSGDEEATALHIDRLMDELKDKHRRSTSSGIGDGGIGDGKTGDVKRRDSAQKGLARLLSGSTGPASDSFEGHRKDGSRAEAMARKRLKLMQSAEECRLRGDIEGAAWILNDLWAQGKDPAIANNLAACLMMLGRLDRAEEVLKEGLEMSPSDPDLNYNLRLLHSMKGKEGGSL